MHQVDGKPQHDSDHQCIAEHGTGHGAGGLKGACTTVACDFHHRDAQAIAKRRVDRDNDKVAGQCRRAIGAFGDRKPQKQGIREQAAKADDDAVFQVAFQQIERHQRAKGETGRSPGVEGDQDAGIEIGRKVHACNRLKQQAGDRKALGELHDPVDARDRKGLGPDRDIAKADDKEDGQDHVKKGLHIQSLGRVGKRPFGEDL